jgi:hypothetical protein
VVVLDPFDRVGQLIPGTQQDQKALRRVVDGVLPSTQGIRPFIVAHSLFHEVDPPFPVSLLSDSGARRRPERPTDGQIDRHHTAKARACPPKVPAKEKSLRLNWSPAVIIDGKITGRAADQQLTANACVTANAQDR